LLKEMYKAKGAPGNQYTGKLNPSLYVRGPKAARTIRAFERGDETGLPLFPEMHAPCWCTRTMDVSII